MRRQDLAVALARVTVGLELVNFTIFFTYVYELHKQDTKLFIS